MWLWQIQLQERRGNGGGWFKLTVTGLKNGWMKRAKTYWISLKRTADRKQNREEKLKLADEGDREDDCEDPWRETPKGEAEEEKEEELQLLLLHETVTDHRSGSDSTGSSALVQRVTPRLIVLGINTKTKGTQFNKEMAQKRKCVYVTIILRSNLQLWSSAREGGNVRKRRTLEFGLNNNQTEWNKQQKTDEGRVKGVDGQEPVFSRRRDAHGLKRCLETPKRSCHFFGVILIVSTHCSVRLHSSSPQPSATPASS